MSRPRRRATPLIDVATLVKGTLVKVLGRGASPYAFQYVRETPGGGVEVTLYGPRGKTGKPQDRTVVQFITVKPDDLAPWG